MTLPRDGGIDDWDLLNLQVQCKPVAPQGGETLQGVDDRESESEDGFDLALFLPSPERVWSSPPDPAQLSSSVTTERPEHSIFQAQDEFAEFDEWLMGGSVEIE